MDLAVDPWRHLWELHKLPSPKTALAVDLNIMPLGQEPLQQELKKRFQARGLACSKRFEARVLRPIDLHCYNKRFEARVLRPRSTLLQQKVRGEKFEAISATIGLY